MALPSDLKNLIRNMTTDVKSTNKALQKFDKDFTILKESLKDLQASRDKVAILEHEKRHLETKLSDCERKVDFLMCRERSKSLVLFKVSDPTLLRLNDLTDSLINIFNCAEVDGYGSSPSSRRVAGRKKQVIEPTFVVIKKYHN